MENQRVINFFVSFFYCMRVLTSVYHPTYALCDTECICWMIYCYLWVFIVYI